MCVGFPAKVTRIDSDAYAIIDYMGVQKRVNISLLPDLKIGEFVLVHAGIVLQRIAVEEAEQLFELFEELRVFGEHTTKKDVQK